MLTLQEVTINSPANMNQIHKDIRMSTIYTIRKNAYLKKFKRS